MAYVRKLYQWTSVFQRVGVRTWCSPASRLPMRSTICRNEQLACRNMSGTAASDRARKSPILTTNIIADSSANIGKYLTVKFNNGKESKMLAIWLRHNCHCSDCVYRPDTKQRKVFADKLEGSPTLQSATLEDDLLHITWLYEDGTKHQGYIETDWLRDNCYNTTMSYTERMKRNRPQIMTFMPVVQYSDVASSSEGLWKWLENLNEYGVCVVKGAPVQLGEVVKIAEFISCVQETIFGKVWDVQVIPGNDEDVAYGCDPVLLHMDEIYYDGPPGISFLHCIRLLHLFEISAHALLIVLFRSTLDPRNDDQVEGGENVIVDAFPVVEEFRKTHPQHFTTLTQIPGTFRRIWTQGNEITENIIRERPHIVVDRYNEVVGINWTQQNGGPVYEKQEDVEKYYKAYIELAKAFETSPFKISNRPQAGDVLTVNNRRVLHSRTMFTLHGGVRHLQGTYVTIDGFKSRLNVLANKLGKAYPIKRMFDNSSL